MTLARRRWLYFGPAALVAGALAVALTVSSDHEAHPALAVALGLFCQLVIIFAGLIGWTRRPADRTGMLMVAVGFGVLVGSLSEANYSVPFTLGALFGSLFIAAFIHLLLVYPSGELLSRMARRLVVAGYVTAFVAPPRRLHSARSSTPLLRKKSAPLSAGRSSFSDSELQRKTNESVPNHAIAMAPCDTAACDTSGGQTRKAYVGREEVCRLTRGDCALAARGETEADVDEAVGEKLRRVVPARRAGGFVAVGVDER